MKTGRQPLEGDAPYFARNRDETDIAYETGWNHAKAGYERLPPYMKDTMMKTYLAGYDAALRNI